MSATHRLTRPSTTSRRRTGHDLSQNNHERIRRWTHDTCTDGLGAPDRLAGRPRGLDAAIVGGKGANLAELVQFGFRVPAGFVVTSKAYLAALDDAGIRTELREMNAAALDDDRDLAARSRELAGARPGRRPPPMALPRHRAGVPEARRALVRRGPLLGHGRGHGGHVVRRHERDVHQRPRRRRSCSTRSSTAGRRCSASACVAYRAAGGSPTSPRSPSSCSAWSTPSARA